MLATLQDGALLFLYKHYACSIILSDVTDLMFTLQLCRALSKHTIRLSPADIYNCISSEESENRRRGEITTATHDFNLTEVLTLRKDLMHMSNYVCANF